MHTDYSQSLLSLMSILPIYFPPANLFIIFYLFVLLSDSRGYLCRHGLRIYIPVDLELSVGACWAYQWITTESNGFSSLRIHLANSSAVRGMRYEHFFLHIWPVVCRSSVSNYSYCGLIITMAGSCLKHSSFPCLLGVTFFPPLFHKLPWALEGAFCPLKPILDSETRCHLFQESPLVSLSHLQPACSRTSCCLPPRVAQNMWDVPTYLLWSQPVCFPCRIDRKSPEVLWASVLLQWSEFLRSHLERTSVKDSVHLNPSPFLRITFHTDLLRHRSCLRGRLTAGTGK